MIIMNHQRSTSAADAVPMMCPYQHHHHWLIQIQPYPRPHPQPTQHSTTGVILNRLITLLFAILCLSSLSTGADIGKYFTRSPQSIVAPPGDRVTFQCETNIPAEQVRWKLNGRFLHPANESDIRVSGTLLSVKVSKNRERYMQQVGDYQCVAEFGAEALTSLPAQLTIAQLDPFQPHTNKSLEIVEGSTVAISCDPPYSNPPPVIQFYKDGRPIEPETAGNSLLTDSGVLHLYNVSSTDAGSYWCSVTNHITTDTYVADWVTQLVIKQQSKVGRKPPEFLIKPKPYYVIPQDGNVTLECVATGNPPPYTTWRKLRAPTMTNYQSNKGTLHLFNVGFSQEGEYICEAYNGVGAAISTLSTVVLNSMPNITKEPMSLIVEEGGEAIIDCASEGLPKPQVYWVFNGQNVLDDGNVQLTDWGLRIFKVEKRHAGLFQCFTTNPMGTVTSPAELKVMPKQITAMASDGTVIKPPVTSVLPPVTEHENENHSYTSVHHHKNNKFHRGKHKRRKHKNHDMTPPSKPTINRLSDESVMIRWDVPPNSGYPIQFFKIQYKEVSRKNSRWMTIDDDIAPHINSYEVRDLRVGHAYRFRIAAVYSNNDNKVGPNSEKFVLQKDATMRRPMHAPVITNAVPHNVSAILLRWKVMKMETSGLDGYFIYYREATSAGDYSKITALGEDSESTFIDHLKAGTAYDIKIQSFNRAGASNFSSIIAAKTTGTATTERPDYDHGRGREDEVIIPDDPPPASDHHLFLLMACIFVAFWIFICLACAVCYKCKQKRTEDEAKYPCDVQLDLENKSIANGGMNGHIHGLNGYIPTITSQLDEKETSFVERYNNNRPISPSLLNSSTCDDLASFKNNSSPLNDASKSCSTEMKTLSLSKKNINESNSRNNSLKRQKHSHNLNVNNGGNNASLRRGQYMSCSSEDLEGDAADCNNDNKSSKDTKIFPKEHYKARKHNRKRNSAADVS